MDGQGRSHAGTHSMPVFSRMFMRMFMRMFVAHGRACARAHAQACARASKSSARLARRCVSARESRRFLLCIRVQDRLRAPRGEARRFVPTVGAVLSVAVRGRRDGRLRRICLPNVLQPRKPELHVATTVERHRQGHACRVLLLAHDRTSVQHHKKQMARRQDRIRWVYRLESAAHVGS